MCVAQPVQLLSILERVLALAMLEALVRDGWDVTLLAAEHPEIRTHAVKGARVITATGTFAVAVAALHDDATS